ncbi:tRNA epoxyqueuosine(34) reductase QueG [Candidatus Poribacteria bacterium]|nr:tRNA epoxyqueuosine(34) reductase QueG [Candidatus Poribacteria bacterium]
MPATEALTDQLKREARAIGFDAVGIARVQPYPHADAFRAWLGRGMHGTMAYIPRSEEKRLDADKVVPGARSIVSVAKLYRTQDIPDDLRDDRERGVIARYAWGDDYHDVMKEQLNELRAWLEERSAAPFDSRVYVDSGPVLEREVAMLAGLGWIGKNTMLMSRDLGSYFFLGEIITTLGLVADEPVTDHCGSCTKCLDACPTDAFPEPYKLDARKCLSYLTIERKGEMPAGYRELAGDNIFGCDICQEVCPWNRKAPLTDDPEYQPREGLVAPELAPLMAMSDEAFRERFRGSPLKRSKRRGLLRNVAVSLGNTCDPDAVPALEAGMADAEPLVRRHAAWALGRIGGKGAEEALRRARTGEGDADVLAEIDDALTQGSQQEDDR